MEDAKQYFLDRKQRLIDYDFPVRLAIWQTLFTEEVHAFEAAKMWTASSELHLSASLIPRGTIRPLCRIERLIYHPWTSERENCATLV